MDRNDYINRALHPENTNLFIGGFHIYPLGFGVSVAQLDAKRDFLFNSKLNKKSKKVWLRNLHKTIPETFTVETLGTLIDKLKLLSSECDIKHSINIIEYNKKNGADADRAFRGAHTCYDFYAFAKDFEMRQEKNLL